MNQVGQSIIETPDKSNNKSYFGIKISGRTFLPFYEAGTVFIFDPKREIINGDIILARINNSSNTLAHYFLKGTDILLKDLNLESEATLYNKDDIKIYGTALQIIQKIV